MKLQRNHPCHCGSGLKYKKCHLPKEQEADRQECAYWKAKIRRVMMDRIADAQMAEMPPPELPIVTNVSSGGYVEQSFTPRPTQQES